MMNIQCKILLFSLVLIGLSGCALTEPERYLDLDINIARVINQYSDHSSGNDNILNDKVSHPISLRLYQLTDDNDFKQLDFIDLFENDRKLLAGSLVMANHLGIFSPRQSHQMRLNLNPATRYIGVFAGFAEYHQSQFKDVIKVSDLAQLQLSLIAAQSSVYLQTPITGGK